MEWTRQEKRTFLRHRVELRLAALYLETLDYTAALPLISECVSQSAALSHARRCPPPPHGRAPPHAGC